jgi:hypothetical protein
MQSVIIEISEAIGSLIQNFDVPDISGVDPEVFPERVDRQ